MKSKRFTYVSEEGFHEKNTKELVKKAASFESEMTISYNEKMVNFKSIMGIMSLGIEHGAEIEITVQGPDEEEAFQYMLKRLKEYEMV